MALHYGRIMRLGFLMRFGLAALAMGLVATGALGQETRPGGAADTRATEVTAARAGGDLNRSTPITLKLAGVSQQQVFEEIANQAGNSFTTQPANFWQKSPGEPISVDWENKPFWMAIRDACGKGGISLKHPLDSSRPVIILARDNQDWTSYPAASSGPFLVNLIGLHRSATVDMRKPSEVQRQFYAKFTIFCEPRIRLLRGSLVAKIESAVDDKQNNLAAPEADGETMNFVTSWVYNIEARMLYPKGAGTKITRLRCSANFLAQTASEVVEIADPLASKNFTKTVAGRKITIRELRRTPEEWEVVATFARDGLSAEQWAGALFPGNTLKLVDGEGREIKAHGFGLGGKGEEASFIFKFDRDGPRGVRFGKPARLTWEVPTQTVTLPVAWEFKELPMP